MVFWVSSYYFETYTLDMLLYIGLGGTRLVSTSGHVSSENFHWTQAGPTWKNLIRIFIRLSISIIY